MVTAWIQPGGATVLTEMDGDRHPLIRPVRSPRVRPPMTPMPGTGMSIWTCSTEKKRGHSSFRAARIQSSKPARAARPRRENHACIRPDWTCLVKGPDRAAALRALDETSPVWRPAWQGFQGSLCPARTRFEGDRAFQEFGCWKMACVPVYSCKSVLLILGLKKWVPVTIYSSTQTMRPFFEHPLRFLDAEILFANKHCYI
ncbi:hypothetical protein SAMN04488568_104183 [Maricaulis salignorans]|uniref:Uncharacterized protein n=1 Tax=Maricaulis salignorans TaxID=144026 RepID=A0A1G9Q6R9_9PROT|nr:hypothetical protein SAMN04488568_104183 [Maricaulis salignorans]